MNSTPFDSGALIIASRNRPEVLERAVTHISRILPDSWEILVIDDGSNPPIDADRLQPARVFRIGQGVGRGAARNKGASLSRGNILAFMDDDIFPGPGCVERLVRHLNAERTWVAPVETHAMPPTLPPNGGARPVRMAPSSLLMTRREAFEEIGGFAQDIPRLLDYELSLRGGTRGHRFLQDEGAVVLHEDQHHSFRGLCLREHDSVRLLPIVWNRHLPNPPGEDEWGYDWFWGNYRTRRWPLRFLAQLLTIVPLWNLFVRSLPSQAPKREALRRLLFRISAVRGAYRGMADLPDDYRKEMTRSAPGRW